MLYSVPTRLDPDVFLFMTAPIWLPIWIPCHVYNKYRKRKKHRRSMQTDPEYRLKHVARPQSDCKLWQDHLCGTTSAFRNILKVAEARDLPREMWQDLQDVEPFPTAAKYVGTPDHAALPLATLAIAHYASLLTPEEMVRVRCILTEADLWQQPFVQMAFPT